MAFQNRSTRGAALALVSTGLWLRFVHASVLTACTVLLVSSLLQVISIILFTAFVYPHFSPLRHIPTAPQRPLRQRFFKEPNPFQFERWVNEVPNDGLIRYFGFLNTERLLIATPEAARQILQVNTYDFKKPDAVRLHLSRFTGKGLAWQEGDGHKFHRPVMDTAFQHKNIKALHPMFWRKAMQLTNLLRQKIDPESNDKSLDLGEKTVLGTEIEIGQYIDLAIFDILGLALHGTDFHAITNPELNYEPYRGFKEAVEPSPSHRNRMLAGFALPGWLVNILPLENNRLAAPAMRAFRRLGKEIIATKQPEKVSKSEVPELFTAVLEQQRFSDEEALNEYLTVQTAGMHPTSSALMSTIWFLSQPKHRHVQLKLREEIHKVRPDASNERAFERMPYLQAVLNEVLRLNSVFTHTGRQPLKETTICGHQLPVDLMISLSPYALHRSKAVWGQDAAEFRPDRWLNNESPTRNSNNFLAFGSNPRYCLGQKFAVGELKCLVSALFGQLDMQFPDETRLPRVTHQVTLAFKDPIKPVVRLVD